jgi:hypothetical protein
VYYGLPQLKFHGAAHATTKSSLEQKNSVSAQILMDWELALLRETSARLATKN